MKKSTIFWIIILIFIVVGLWYWGRNGFFSSSSPDTGNPSPTSTDRTTPPATDANGFSLDYEITIQDNSKTYTYPVTTRFSVVLDGSKYPKSNLGCAPSGIIGTIANTPNVPANAQYAATFEAVAPGTCTLKDNDFSVTIQVKEY